MFFSILIFIFILGLLVLAHELGHFLVAKRRGVKVEEFGFGFPPRIFSVKRGETVYSLNLIPLGGFVKVFGETESIEPASADVNAVPNSRSFAFRPLWERALIVVAGVVGNVLLAWLLFSVAHTVGVPRVVEDGGGTLRDVRVVITDVAPRSPAEAAGIVPGDNIIRLSSSAAPQFLEAIERIEMVQEFITAHRGEEIIMTVRRGSEEREIRTIPRKTAPVGEGALGIAMVRTALQSYRWYVALGKGWETVFQLGRAIMVGVGSLLFALVTEGRLIADVAGPVGIAVLSHEAALLGFSYLVFFAGLLSLNLAIINLLPFPALDGGRLLFLAIEKLKGSPVSQRAERLAHTAGFAFLMALMVLVTYRDVLRLF